MTDILKNSFVHCLILLGLTLSLMLVMLSGCGESEKSDTSVFLIKTPALLVTKFEFSEELDLKRAAYPYNIDENPAEYNEMVIHLLKMLSEEMILLNAAIDKGVIITDEELALAETEFKKDYPDDSFDQMLLTNAIPYRLWKKRFKRDMIIDKLVNQELVEKIEITPQDIVKFYNDLKTEQDPKDTGESSGETDKKFGSEMELVSRLRLQKTQEKYEKWIEDLRDLYPVEINKEELRTFMLELENI